MKKNMLSLLFSVGLGVAIGSMALAAGPFDVAQPNKAATPANGANVVSVSVSPSPQDGQAGQPQNIQVAPGQNQQRSGFDQNRQENRFGENNATKTNGNDLGQRRDERRGHGVGAFAILFAIASVITLLLVWTLLVGLILRIFKKDEKQNAAQVQTVQSVQ